VQFLLAVTALETLEVLSLLSSQSEQHIVSKSGTALHRLAILIPNSRACWVSISRAGAGSRGLAAFKIRWNPGTLEHWNPGTLEPWNPGTLEPWNLGILENLESWKPGKSGTLEPWNPETLEARNPGTLEP